MKPNWFMFAVAMIVLCLIPIACASVWWTDSPDVVLNETSDFDAGFKANNSDGNYNIETYTDNLNISSDAFELSGKYSDRFTFADADADTWKWVYFEDEGFSVCNGEIDSGKLNMSVYSDAGGYNWVRLNGVKVRYDFDIMVNYSGYDTDAGVYDVYATLGLSENSNMWVGAYVITLYRDTQDTNSDGIMENNYTASDGITWEEGDALNDYGALRIKRDYDDADTCTWYWYYADGDGGWVLLDSRVEDGDVNYCGEFYVFLSQMNFYGLTGGANVLFDDFLVDDTIIVADTGIPYKQTGNWTSASQEMVSGGHIDEVVINFTKMNDDTYLDFFNIINSTGAVVFNYAGDLHMSGGIASWSTVDWAPEVIDTNFTLQVGLKGDGYGTPTVDDIIVYYAAPPVITVDSPDNASYCGDVWFNTTSIPNADWCGYSLDGLTNVSMTNTTGKWWALYEGTNCTDNVHNVTIYCNNTDGEDSETIWFWVCPCCDGDDSAYPLICIFIAGIFAFLYVKSKEQWMKWLFLGMFLVFVLACLYISVQLSETDFAQVSANLEVYMLAMIGVFVMFIFVMFIILLKQAIEMWIPKKRSFREE